MEGFIDVTGGKIFYRIAGAEKKGVPLLTLHGGPGAPHQYLEPLEALAESRPVVFYDQLGCGNSDMPDDASLWTVERFAEELSVLRKALGLEKVHIMGHSWGTILAVEHVKAFPAGVKSLVLSSPCMSAALFARDCRALVAKLPGYVRDIIYEAEKNGKFETRQYCFANDQYFRRHVCRIYPWPDCLKRSMKKFGYAVYSHMCGPSEFTATGVLKDFDNTAALADIRIPVLFTCGEFDEVTPETTKHYQGLLPGSEMIVFDNASHKHHLEQSEKYCRAVDAFLKKADNQL